MSIFASPSKKKSTLALDDQRISSLGDCQNQTVPTQNELTTEAGSCGLQARDSKLNYRFKPKSQQTAAVNFSDNLMVDAHNSVEEKYTDSIAASLSDRSKSVADRLAGGHFSSVNTMPLNNVLSARIKQELQNGGRPLDEEKKATYEMQFGLRVMPGYV